MIICSLTLKKFNLLFRIKIYIFVQENNSAMLKNNFLHSKICYDQYFVKLFTLYYLLLPNIMFSRVWKYLQLWDLIWMSQLPYV